MALACAFAQFTLSALPFIRTTTRGLPVAATASIRFSSGCGRSRLVRSPPRNPGSFTGISSPSSSLVIPTTAIVTSAAFAAAMASGEGAGLYFAHSNCAFGSPAGDSFAYVTVIGTFTPRSRCSRPIFEFWPPMLKICAKGLPSTMSRPNPSAVIPSR